MQMNFQTENVGNKFNTDFEGFHISIYLAPI